MMEIQRVDACEYNQFFLHVNHVYNSVSFNELNRNKCLALHYLVFRDKKVRLGIILGEQEYELCSPFSAPFGGFSYKKNEKLEHFDSAVELLGQYGKTIGKAIQITLPPTIYGSSVSKMYSSLVRKNAVMQYVDLNYQYELKNFPFFEQNLDSGTRNKFHNSRKNNFDFIKLDSTSNGDIRRAYSIIKKNREERGFPLRMSLQAVQETAHIVDADFFVMSFQNIDVAAAQVYKVTDSIAQVIYWGDLPEYSDLRVMNYFTYKVFEYYYNQNLQILDIGPSTENGIPNYGLCEFKENIGCSVSLKYSLCI